MPRSRNSKIINTTTIVAAIIGVVVGMFATGWLGSDRESTTNNKFAAAAARHLTNIQQRDGTFIYEIDLLSGKSSTANNMVRQAGTGYGLAEYYAYSNDQAVKPALEAYLTAMASASIALDNGMLVSINGQLTGVKTGTTALALLALLNVEKVQTIERFSAWRTVWLQGLMSLYNDGGGFRRGTLSIKESPYYNGESWLALAVHADMYPDQSDMQRLANLDDYLMKTYGSEFDKGFFHWGVMAASQRYRTTRERRFLDFAITQSEFYLKQNPLVRPTLNSCYVVEGLAAVVAILDDAPIAGDLETRNKLMLRVDQEMNKNVSFQNHSTWIEAGDARISSAAIARYKGAFRNGQYLIKARIDFTQHCLSALVKQSQM
ncbi:MAG: hypothetical protein DHS20C01_22760 [marine bacterium B5-7]|nr:MAG: hypothetical protein DHS20C01_22760 [marine bacterium B5-7]